MSHLDRFHALDAARALALLLGIVLHAAMSFFLPVPAQDVSQSATLAVTFYVIHIFRMSLFFMIAGFFAHLVFHRRGLRAFVKDRARRILVPLLAGWVVVAPPTIVVIVWGVTRTFPDGPPEGVDAAAAARQGFPLTHLWFLYYLCIFYALMLVLRGAFVALVDRRGELRARIDAAVGVGVGTRLALLALASPIGAVLYFTEGWQVWFGIPTPDTGFTPQVPALVGFGTAFVSGWLLHRQTDLLYVLEGQWLGNLALAVGLTAACLALAGPIPAVVPAPATVVGDDDSLRLVYAAAYALAMWCWCFGLIGAAMRFCGEPSAVRRYLADSSYWLYLMHLPIVFALQVLLMDVPLHWTIKFPLIVGIALAVLLASYHYLVRSTFVGATLNGRKYPRDTAAAATSLGT